MTEQTRYELYRSMVEATRSLPSAYEAACLADLADVYEALVLMAEQLGWDGK